MQTHNLSNMSENREIFFRNMGLPSAMPLALEVEKAEGIYLYTPDGERYIDLNSGVTVSNIGHRHPKVMQAIKKQLDHYLHLQVYGKYIQSPQTQLAGLLANILPHPLDCSFFVNSGSEAIEGALKLAKRATGRHEIIAFKNAYHGGTHGALSLMGNEALKYAFRPLLPGVSHISYNDDDELQKITNKTACVVVEPVQAEAGIIVPDDGYLKKLKNRCRETGSLLVFDEIQMAFGRTGKMFCLEHSGVVPDIITMAKSLGGGLPLGAFTASKKLMMMLTEKPELGHITTFGGHPLCCASALASLEVIINEKLHETAENKGQAIAEIMHGEKKIKEIRRSGLMLAIEMENESMAHKAVEAMAENHLITDRFLFRPQAFRIAPPLNISNAEIEEVCQLILDSLKKA